MTPSSSAKARVRAFHIKTATSESIRELLITNIHRSSELDTDESKLYTAVGGEFAAHKTVHHGLNQSGRHVGPEGQTTNAVENFFSNFKRSMRGTYRGCSQEHLHRHLSEFAFRHNNRSGLGVNDGERTAIALMGTEGKRLTYRPTHNTSAAQTQG